jgi:hypothetical protein
VLAFGSERQSPFIVNKVRFKALSMASRKVLFKDKNMGHYRLKTIWSRMKDRCYNEAHISFKYYGARGIGICDLWLNSFDAFETWALLNGYESHLSLDRVNTFGGYSPDNCRWATNKMQQGNRRDSVKRLFNGQMMNASEIAEISGKSYIAEYLTTKRLIKKEAENLNKAS